MAKISGFPQPTVTYLRKALEKRSHRTIHYNPKPSLLRLRHNSPHVFPHKRACTPFWDKVKKWAAKQPNVVFVSTGQGMNSDTIIVSVHKDYADFVRFYHVFRRDRDKHLRDFKIFLMSIKGSAQLKAFSFN